MRNFNRSFVGLFLLSAIFLHSEIVLADSEPSDAGPTDALLERYPYDIGFTVTNPVNNEGRSGVTYRVAFPSGISAQGVTDAQGHTARFRTEKPEKLKLYVKAPDNNLQEEIKEKGNAQVASKRVWTPR
jgi:hypothetical protein